MKIGTDINTKSKNEINELLIMFELEPLTESEDIKSELVIEDNLNRSANTTNETTVSSRFESKGIQNTVIITVLILFATLLTLFFYEENIQNKVFPELKTNHDLPNSEIILVKNPEDSKAESINEKNIQSIVKREFNYDPSEFESYEDNLNYFDMTLLIDEDLLIIVTPKGNTLFLMSEPKVTSLEMVNMLDNEIDYAGVLGVYSNYLHVYFPVDDYEYQGWVRMGDANLYILNNDETLTKITSKDFNEIVNERLITKYYNKPTNIENTEANLQATEQSVMSTSNKYFKIASSSYDVQNVMGHPSSITNYTFGETWYYGISSIEFENGFVTGYHDYDNNLKVWLGDQIINRYFTLNSSKDEVIKANGTPTGISSFSFGETWYYDHNSVDFSAGRVNGYHDYSNQLNVSLGSAIKGMTFGIGSTKEDVIKANGTPTGISDFTFGSTWYYGISSVSFDSNGLVESYSNWDENLKIKF